MRPRCSDSSCNGCAILVKFDEWTESIENLLIILAPLAHDITGIHIRKVNTKRREQCEVRAASVDDGCAVGIADAEVIAAKFAEIFSDLRGGIGARRGDGDHFAFVVDFHVAIVGVL